PGGASEEPWQERKADHLRGDAQAAAYRLRGAQIRSALRPRTGACSVRGKTVSTRRIRPATVGRSAPFPAADCAPYRTSTQQRGQQAGILQCVVGRLVAQIVEFVLDVLADPSGGHAVRQALGARSE